jgi:hypothetical protein
MLIKKSADEVVTKIVNADPTRQEYVLALEFDFCDEQAIRNE